MTLLELFQLLKKHLKLVITLPVVCAIAMGIVSGIKKRSPALWRPGRQR